MISKGEAIMRLKKMGVTVADDQSIVTIILPSDVSLLAGIKDIKEKFKNMDYAASFCIRQEKKAEGSQSKTEKKEEANKEMYDEEENVDTLSEEDLRESFFSMDEDGQFTLDGFGIDL